MRCNDCSKFVAYGEPRTDDIAVEIDESSGIITLSGELYLTCEQCGSDLASCSLEAECDASELFPEAGDEIGSIPDATVTYELDGDPDIEATDRSQTHDRHGKPIKNTRYAKRYYGVSAIVTIRRLVGGKPAVADSNGGDTADATLSAEEKASGFEAC